MSKHANPYAVEGNPVQELIAYGAIIEAMGLEKSLMELIKIRTSQLNGCAGCILWHTRDARQQGETEARIYMLDAWRESPLYTPRERAAIAWAEALTRLDRRDTDEAYELVAAEFTPAEQVTINLLIGVINAFNRINVGFAVVPPVAEQDRRAA